MNEGIVVYSKKGDVIFTSTGEIKVVDKKQTRYSRNIIHQVFENLKMYNTDDDTEMDTFLSNASRNIFSKNYKYVNGMLYKRVYKNKFDLYVNSNNLEKTYTHLKEFIQKEETIQTVKLIEPAPQIITDHQPEVSSEEMMYCYILSMKDKHNLSLPEVMELESIIKIGLISDFINESNIIIKNNKIDCINFLLFDEETRKFKIGKNTVPKLIKKEIKKIIPNEHCSKQINKFVSHITKKN